MNRITLTLSLLILAFLVSNCTRTIFLTPEQYCETKTLKQYKVKKNDSLNKIAKGSNTTVDCIKKLNHLRSNTISPGEILYLPQVLTGK